MRRLTGFLTCLLTSVVAGSAMADARVIVKLKDDAPVMRRALAAERSGALSARLGLGLRHRSEPAPGMLALGSGELSTAELLKRLRSDPAVEYAVEDRLRDARALPNDPLYAGQWYLKSGQAAAIGAEQAWDVTTGDASVVVAVLDTGILPRHPDLRDRVLPGYDFISEPALSGDGDGRDADPSDNGDYVDASDQANAELQSICGEVPEQQSSSWHGTRVAGVLAAAGNNSTGIAGTSWTARILPVRVLGKCGGFDSDIIAAMRWAGGLKVAGVPDNPNPARILNLSLGGSSPCSAAYATVVAELKAAGVLVVTAAGNETGPVESPGNCSGVLSVAGVRHVGTKVGYSSMGSEVGISAPAGNCVNPTLPCLFPINTTSNAGTTAPAANVYTDENAPNIGTSFSAPQVAGVAALMLAANPAQTPEDLILRLKSTARPFAVDPVLPTCPTTADGPDTIGQCNCTASTCGAGMLDAAAAVGAAAAPVAKITAPTGATAGDLLSLSGSASQAMAGRRIASWLWQIASAPQGAALTAPASETTGLQAPTAGIYVVRLTVTDDAGGSSDAVVSISVAEAVTPPVDDSTGNDGSDTSGGTDTGSTDGSGSSGGGGGGGGGSTDGLLLALLLGAWPWLRARRGPTRRQPANGKLIR